MLVDFDSIPKSTPKAALRIIADLVECNTSLKAQLADANALVADKAIASIPKPRYDREVFSRVNVRRTRGGETYYNCQLVAGLPSGSKAASKALGCHIADVQRGDDGTPKVMTDRNGHQWANFLPTLRTGGAK